MDAQKSVLLIGKSQSFMVLAVKNGLIDEGFEVVSSEIDIDAISRIDKIPPIWILYLNDSVTDLDNLMVFIRDKIIEYDLFFYVIGNLDELAKVSEQVGESFIKEKFQRPLNVSMLAAALERGIAEWDKLSEKKKILIIDDNPTTLHSLQALLEEKYRVFIVSSGINGISFLIKQPVDLILLDYEMPVADGPQVLEMLRQEGNLSSIPVMFLTGKSDKDSVLKAVSLKPERYLLKNMSPEDLLDRIDNFFEQSRS